MEKKLKQALNKKQKIVAMVAPSFVVDFSYPEIIWNLKKLGIDKVVELTFGAKMVNRGYHSVLNSSKELKISSVCPGIVDIIEKKYPFYKKNLICVDSPMIAMAKVCKKIYPQHKVLFVSPCNYKKIEATNSKFVDIVIDYKELKKIFEEKKISSSGSKIFFDKFYNDYTKVYPLTGGLSKTAHLKGIVKKKEIKIIDGVKKVMKFLNKPNKKIKFLDCNFCVGGCIGGPCVANKEKTSKRKKRVLNYLQQSLREDIPETRKGLVKRAEGISFVKNY
jgi:iron only hydrogenase large subunit-like protein